MYKKPIIIFEGIEASGKSTNIKIISTYLKKINRDFVKIREPGGSKFSEKITTMPVCIVNHWRYAEFMRYH